MTKSIMLWLSVIQNAYNKNHRCFARNANVKRIRVFSCLSCCSVCVCVRWAEIADGSGRWTWPQVCWCVVASVFSFTPGIQEAVTVKLCVNVCVGSCVCVRQPFSIFSMAVGTGRGYFIRKPFFFCKEQYSCRKVPIRCKIKKQPVL